jgi:hypothetical protein
MNAAVRSLLSLLNKKLSSCDSLQYLKHITNYKSSSVTKYRALETK